MEENPDPRIPLHWNHNGDPDSLLHYMGRPDSTIHDNLDYEDEINTIRWDKDYKK